MTTKYFYLLGLIIGLNLNAAEINVPADYATIQDAIFAANTGDVIIVANGIYYENINFFAKDITVTSNFHFTGDINDIINTVIDGSQPVDSDLGSCVTFGNGETENAVLKGFTLTGGSGTKTYNPNDMAYFRTGGGVLINTASPTIINNIIKDNACTAETGVAGAGGGGIRMGFGQPKILNNIITNNLGGYAGGMMIAYCSGATIKNNVIAYNTATGSFNGGGGVYVDWESIILENNTIVYNHSDDLGGGIISTGTTTVVINSIVYGNTATNGSDQIFKRFGGNAHVTYTNIEGGFDGAGNEEGQIDQAPLFDNLNNFFLDPASPCVDAGNPNSQYNDLEDSLSPGNALFPSLGTIVNDMGAYGGQGAVDLLSIEESTSLSGIEFSYQNPYKNDGIIINSNRDIQLSVSLYSYNGRLLSKPQEVTINKGNNNLPLFINSSCLVVFNAGKKKSEVIKLIKL